MFTQNCDVCRMIGTTRAIKRISLKAPMRSHRPPQLESRNDHQSALIVPSYGIRSYPTNDRRRRRHFMVLAEIPGKKSLFRHLMEFHDACQDLQWTHDANTRNRSETNGAAERAVRRVKEGTASAILLLAERARQDGRWQARTC